MLATADLKTRIESAVSWLVDIAQIKDARAWGVRSARMPYTFWNGAIRGEYKAADKTWDCYCPIWHTGQAIKSLVMASDALNRPELLEDAKFSAEFIMRNRIDQGIDAGLILAFEDHPDKVNVSAILESLDGLLHLSQATGDSTYQDAALTAAKWVKERSFCPGRGIFNDIYDPQARQFLFGVSASQGRPLLDDAIFVKAWRLTGDAAYKDVAVQTAETLLRDESPAGNWITYIPCDQRRECIHPRHAFWWGSPMLEVYQATHDERFLACMRRATEWYRQAMRRDGGFIRNTYADFTTDSFGHATSGTACAVICFLRYLQETGDERLIEPIESGLKFCAQMQFVNPDDLNLKGAILEKILPPDGTDRSPYHLRDLGTIFFIQAACLYLKILAQETSRA